MHLLDQVLTRAVELATPRNLLISLDFHAASTLSVKKTLLPALHKFKPYSRTERKEYVKMHDTREPVNICSEAKEKKKRRERDSGPKMPDIPVGARPDAAWLTSRKENNRTAFLLRESGERKREQQQPPFSLGPVCVLYISI